MAARIEPGRVQAAHQSLHHLIAKANWSDAAVLAQVRTQVSMLRSISSEASAENSPLLLVAMSRR
jgi:SRSO17 transposase